MSSVKESPTLVDGDGSGLSRLTTESTVSTKGAKGDAPPELSVFGSISASVSSISLPKGIRMPKPKPTDWSTRRWRPRANATELTELLSEGDIILFAGSRAQDSCLSCLTHCEYTHVAIVIKAGDTLESIELHILESELSQGVSKCPLTYYLKVSRWARLNKRFAKIAVRRLFVNGERVTYQHKRELYKFVAQAMGKSYTTGVSGAITMARAFLRNPATPASSKRGSTAAAGGETPGGRSKRSSTTKGNGSSNAVAEKKEYFCSELVAAAYLAMGLLPADSLPQAFIPSDFAYRGRRGLPLVNGASLTKEIIVDFEPSSDDGLPAPLPVPADDPVDQMMANMYAGALAVRWIRITRQRKAEREAAALEQRQQAPLELAPSAAPPSVRWSMGVGPRMSMGAGTGTRTSMRRSDAAALAPTPSFVKTQLRKTFSTPPPAVEERGRAASQGPSASQSSSPRRASLVATANSPLAMANMVRLSASVNF